MIVTFAGVVARHDELSGGKELKEGIVTELSTAVSTEAQGSRVGRKHVTGVPDWGLAKYVDRPPGSDPGNSRLRDRPFRGSGRYMR